MALLLISLRGIHRARPESWVKGMPKPSATRYRMTNSSAYDAALRERGSPSVWFDPEMDWHAGKTGRRGGPETFLDAAIHT